MADKLTKEQVALAIEAFSHFDKDGDGTISTKELGTLMRKVGEKPSKAGIEALMNEFDVDQNGKISFPEFLALMAKIMGEEARKNEIEEAFRVFDQNGDGFITTVEFRQVISDLNLKVKPAPEEVGDMIRKADADGDGRVDYKEFVRWWTSEVNH